MTALPPSRARRVAAPPLLGLALLACGLAACGPATTSQGPAAPGAPAALTVFASATQPLVNSAVTITASVISATGAPVAAGTPVDFTATGGVLSNVTGTSPAGIASATLVSAAGGTITVTAAVGALAPRTLLVTFLDPNAPVAVSLATSASAADVRTTVRLTATVRPAGAVGVPGAVPDGTVVTFSTSAGALSQVTTTAGGVATAVLGGVTAAGDVTVTASAGGAASPPLLIRFADPDLPASVAVSAAPATGLIGGLRPVVVTARAVRAGGGPVAAGTPVTFAVLAGPGRLAAASALTDAAGAASTTVDATAAGTVTVSAACGPAPAASLELAFTDPSRPNGVALFANPASGVAGGIRPVTLTAIVSPADALLGSVADGTPVTFTIVSGTGTLSAATDLTANGVASVILDAPGAGAVSVTARVGTAPVVTSNAVTASFAAQPTQVVVTLKTIGVLPPGAAIGGVSAFLAASPGTGLSLAAQDHVVTGAGAGALLVANPASLALDRIALIHAGGMAVGTFATVTYQVSPGALPSPGDFVVGVYGPGVVDLNGVPLAGVTVAIQAVRIQ